MKNIDGELIDKVRRICKEYSFYPDREEKTLVGFSGGADSVSLLHVLMRLLGPERLVAIHINHGLRGAEADRDEAFCRDFCRKMRISFYSHKIDVAALCGGTGFENTARNVRYRIFEEDARTYGCATVSLAHTANDNLETMIFNLCRGAGLSGLGGIPPMRPLGSIQVVRPLIACEREEILRYLNENQLSFVVDSTNADVHYTRNFIRAQIVPLLQKVNAAAAENAASAAASVRKCSFYLACEAQNFIKAHRIETGAPAKLLRELDRALLYPVLETMFQKAGGDTLYAEHAEMLYLLLTNRQTGNRITLPGKITAVLDGDTLKFLSEANWRRQTAKNEFIISLHPGKNTLPDGTVIFISENGKMPKLSEETTLRLHSQTILPAETLASLSARTRRPGDAYRFGGMTRILKKLLCGADNLTKRRPVICDKDGILWVPGFPVTDGKRTENGITLFYFEKDHPER